MVVLYQAEFIIYSRSKGLTPFSAEYRFDTNISLELSFFSKYGEFIWPLDTYTVLSNFHHPDIYWVEAYNIQYCWL